jgi:hypothetical protein
VGEDAQNANQGEKVKKVGMKSGGGSREASMARLL